MDYDKFKKIIDKSSSIGINGVSLYNWTEPFLCKNIHNYACYIKEKNMHCDISTNLALPNIPNLIPTLKFCDRLIISVSGFNQDTYSINHRGGNINYVKRNLEIISDAKKRNEISTKVIIRYIMFDYNKHEFELFEKFGNSLGLLVEEHTGAGKPKQNRNKNLKNNNESAWFNEYINANLPHFDYIKTDMVCVKAVDSFIVDSHGSCFLCCLVPTFKNTKVGNFLDDDIDMIQFRRHTHPFCAFCRLKKLISPSPEQKLTLLRGAIKSFGI